MAITETTGLPPAAPAADKASDKIQPIQRPIDGSSQFQAEVNAERSTQTATATRPTLGERSQYLNFGTMEQLYGDNQNTGNDFNSANASASTDLNQSVTQLFQGKFANAWNYLQATAGD